MKKIGTRLSISLRLPVKFPSRGVDKEKKEEKEEEVDILGLRG